MKTIIPLTLLSYFFLCGFLPAKHSKLKIETAAGKDKITFTFKVIPDSGMKATFDNAPWRLTIKTAPGLKPISNPQMDIKELDKNLPGFRWEAQPTAAKGSLEYVLHAFICTADKTRCYPETHKGTYNWTR